MNKPPSTFIRVPHEDLKAFVSTAAQRVGLPPDKAILLAELLTANDLRGVWSHGTQQIAGYARLMRDGALNAKPRVHTVRETATSLQLDGDGGLGYFPAYEGTLRIIEKAKEHGIAILSTRNHGHFGAAGLYSRLPLEHDLLTFVTSGHQLGLAPGQPLVTMGGGSPMSFSVPTGEEDPFILDFGAMHDLYAGSPHREEIARLAPGLVFRTCGLGAITQIWGGFLAGVPVDASRASRTFSGANQGALVITFKIELFLPPAQFKREVDEYLRKVHALEPLEGFDAVFHAGGLEAAREREYRQRGVPVGPRHQERLAQLADELGISVPWDD